MHSTSLPRKFTTTKKEKKRPFRIPFQKRNFPTIFRKRETDAAVLQYLQCLIPIPFFRHLQSVIIWFPVFLVPRFVFYTSYFHSSYSLLRIPPKIVCLRIRYIEYIVFCLLKSTFVCFCVSSFFRNCYALIRIAQLVSLNRFSLKIIRIVVLLMPSMYGFQSFLTKRAPRPPRWCHKSPAYSTVLSHLSRIRLMHSYYLDPRIVWKVGNIP